jgi:hypothetical protein
MAWMILNIRPQTIRVKQMRGKALLFFSRPNAPYLNPIEKKDLAENDQILICLGGAEGDRTPDLMTASHALSHLSYSPIIGVKNTR